MSGRKGQITLFFIIALLLGLTVAFALYIRLQGQQDLSEKAEDVVVQWKKTPLIKNYVTSCLDSLTKEAIVLSLGQGGNIYEHQGGNLSLEELERGADFVEVSAGMRNFTTSYGVRFDSSINKPLSPVVKNPPAYPFPEANLSSVDKILPRKNTLVGTKGNLLGTMTAPKLCDLEGPNSWGRTTGNCLIGTYDENDTIQQQVKLYLNNHIDRCVNKSIFSYLDYNLTLSGEPKVEFIFGVGSVFSELNYPLTVTLPEGDVEKFAVFRNNYDLRMKRLYNLFYDLAKQEVSDPFFNISQYNESIFYREGIYVSRERDFLKEKEDELAREVKQRGVLNDDLLVMIDYESKIDNNPLLFLSVIENRPPALDYIHPSNSDNYDLMAYAGEKLRIDPLGVDPDRDNITYRYKGWRQDYEERLNRTKPWCLERVNTPEGSQPEAHLTESNIAQLAETCMERAPVGREKWMDSSLFNSTEQNSTLNLTIKDLGYHEVNVSVEESSGLKDWQELRILVLNASCSDSMKNGFETDVDCGGRCEPCGVGESCSSKTDCVSLNCNSTEKICKKSTCSNGLKDGNETGVDCGGTECEPCT